MPLNVEITGGPVYPQFFATPLIGSTPLTAEDAETSEGMTLRDLFAGQAMSAYIESAPIFSSRSLSDLVPGTIFLDDDMDDQIINHVADMSVRFADALVERLKKTSS